MSKRQQQKTQTRLAIRESAKHLFTEQGYNATTSRQIARRAGVALGTIFVHFPDKNAILTDILFEDIETTTKQAFLGVVPGRSTAANLLHLAEALYTYYLERPDLSRALLQNSLFATAEETNFSQQIEVFIAELTHLIQQGQSCGDVTPTKDPKLMATSFMASYFFVLMGLLREEFSGVEGALQQLGQLTRQILS